MFKKHEISVNSVSVMGQHYLGLMYANGEGIPEDHVQAYAWFSVAAAQGAEGPTWEVGARTAGIALSDRQSACLAPESTLRAAPGIC